MQWLGVSYCEFDGKPMETETTTWSEFPNGRTATADKILTSEKRNKSKRADCESHSMGSSRKVNHLRKFISDRKIITEFTRSISSTGIG